jgi:hypothetical protein
MNRRPVHELWLTFKKQCIPPTAGLHQKSVMRDSFYAGALALFQSMNESVSEGEDITAEDLGHMAAIQADLLGYPDRREVEAP